MAFEESPFPMPIPTPASFGDPPRDERADNDSEAPHLKGNVVIARTISSPPCAGAPRWLETWQGIVRSIRSALGLEPRDHPHAQTQAFTSSRTETSSSDLHLLVALVRDRYVFSSDTYPCLKTALPEEKLRFALRHCALHFAKTSGQLAAICEALDHGEQLNSEDLRELSPKSLINALKLAEISGMSHDDLIASACERYLYQ